MDATHARGLLRTFQQLQTEHEAERARLAEVPHDS
jgi:hypothetical protein